MDHSAPHRPSRSFLLAAGVLILCGLIGRAAYIGAPVNSDTAMFVYQGKLVSEGGRMGIDLLDNKLPSVGLLMSVPWSVIGPNWAGYGLLGFAMSVVASLVLARAARRNLADCTYWPVLVASAIWLNFPPAVYGQMQLETIQVFFISIAASCALELLTHRDWRDGLAAGLSIGIAIWAKPTAAAIAPAVVAAILFASGWPWHDRLKACLALCGGVFIPLTVCAGLLILTGMAEGLPGTLAQLRDYSANSTAELADAFKPLFVAAVLLFPLLVMGVVFRRDRIDTTVPKSRAMVLLLVGWFMMEMVGVIAQRRMYAYHFLVLAPPAAMLFGLVARTPRIRSICFALGPAALLCAVWGWQVITGPDTNARTHRVATYLRHHAAADARLWADDYPLLMIESQLRPASVVPLTFLFANSDAAPLAFGNRILADFAHAAPDYVVLHEDVETYIRFYQSHMAEIAAYPARRENFATAWRAIDAYVQDGYEPVEQVGSSIIYRRHTDAVAAAAH